MSKVKKKISDAKPKKAAKEPKTAASILTSVYNKAIDAVEKSFQLNTGMSEQKRVSSGLLVNDYIMGGGFAPGMAIFVGKEQSAKSTGAMTALGKLITSSVPVLYYFDPENALDPKYTGAVIGRKLDDIFGKKDAKGNYTEPPRCRYSDENVVETVFGSIATILRALPDKMYRPELEKWFLVFDRKKKSVAQMNAMGLKHDKALYSETGRYWCEIEDGGLQAAFVIDSFPQLVPGNVEEGESEGNAMALMAREFAKHLPRVKGRLRRKKALLLGINQMRENPGARFGNPEYEAGGNALKLNSDMRNRFAGRAVPEGFDRHEKKFDVCVEPSVEFPGKTDRYQFKHISNIKNKWGTPFQSGWSRVWIKDGKGNARGFDPVFDCWEFLNLIGVIEGSRKKTFKIKLDGFEKLTFTWESFKMLILAETSKSSDLLKKACKMLHVKKTKRLRATCHRMLDNGTAFTMSVNAESKAEEEELADDLEDLEDD